MKKANKYSKNLVNKITLPIFIVLFLCSINICGFITAYASNEVSSFIEETQDLTSYTSLENETPKDEVVTEIDSEKKTDSKTKVNFVTDVVIPVIIEFLGAFLGVISAIWLSRNDERKKIKELNSSIQRELLTIYHDLKDYLEKEKDEFYRYDTTIWDINLTSGAFNNLDYSTYAKYITIYSKIKYAQEIEREWSHSVIISNPSEIAKNFIEATNLERKRLGNEILKDIKKIVMKE